MEVKGANHLSFRIITSDKSLVYETKHVFRYLLATVIRRLHTVGV